MVNGSFCVSGVNADDSSQAQSESETEAELPTVFDILDIGESYEYVIPRFCCISMDTTTRVGPICRRRQGRRNGWFL